VGRKRWCGECGDESENAIIIETSQDGDWFQLAFTTSGKEAIIKISYEK
jgi:hypothetical protein